MPYIINKVRNELIPEMEKSPQTPGELNFQLTVIILNYMDNLGPSYNTMNDIVGALESCKLEFYRRIVIPHEDQAIKRNGDVYNV